MIFDNILDQETFIDASIGHSVQMYPCFHQNDIGVNDSVTAECFWES